jgi:hypothetical protein
VRNGRSSKYETVVLEAGSGKKMMDLIVALAKNTILNSKHIEKINKGLD